MGISDISGLQHGCPNMPTHYVAWAAIFQKPDTSTCYEVFRSGLEGMIHQDCMS